MSIEYKNKSKLMDGKLWTFAVALSIVYGVLYFTNYFDFSSTAIGLFTNFVDIGLSALVVLVFGVAPAVVISTTYWLVTRKQVKSVFTVTFWICFGFASLSSVTSMFRNVAAKTDEASVSESKNSNDYLESLKTGQLVIRHAIRAGDKYPEEYFVQEHVAPFAEYMKEEFIKEFPRFGLNVQTLQAEGVEITSAGELLEIEGQLAFLAVVAIGPITDKNSIWSINLLGNGLFKSISVQCLGIRENKELVFNGECKSEFIRLISDEAIR